MGKRKPSAFIVIVNPERKTMSKIMQYIFGILEQYRGMLVAAVAFLVIWLLYKLLTRHLTKYIQAKHDNAKQFLLIWRYAWYALGIIVVTVSFSGSFLSLGVSAALVGMILGWSLQAPVTGIAAWLMIIIKRPFSIGDRITISGITGDVVDITLTHVILNQVGGTVSGEELSGRGVMIPNAILFQQIIHNYNFETQYLLDEVLVTVTYESDYDEAERILLESARECTPEIIKKTAYEPVVRNQLADSGIILRLRYQTLVKERQRISSNIVRVIIREFNKTKTVEFCYPHTEVLYRPKQENG